MVEQDYRGQRIGELLLRHVEGLVRTHQLFVTTNLSNRAMQRLLKRLEYVTCGFIDQLDPGDPEVIFVKRFAKGKS
jgi:ribosomal protein S18 acetylase RimI-like enzyme